MGNLDTEVGGVGFEHLLTVNRVIDPLAVKQCRAIALNPQTSDRASPKILMGAVREEQKNKIPAFMGNLPIQTVICGVPRLVSYFPAKP